MTKVWIHPRTRVWTAQMTGESDALDDAANTVLRSVKRVAAESRDTGDYISHLGIKTVPGEFGTGRTVKDRLVVADDPGAAAIEWGHLVPLGEGMEGPQRFVPGKNIMGRGLAAVKSDG